MIFLDTSFLSQVFRRPVRASGANRAALEYERIIRESDPVGIPGLVAQEVLSGLRTDGEFDRMLAILDGFPILLADRSHHISAAKIFNLCAQRGISASSGDCLIAALAIAHNATLATLDVDFAHMAKRAGLKLHRF